ncbi:uncharacterized protein EDB91DRAFT_1238915 [Suillus paluster]|uniref:uncharacterized protein n=1 Tax=Suillus paluster TaxID=48578 RepID=UPI001B86AFD3|nr:uncharacterized protein EDB91DRAFT_1238915 [Suillus paluster]KAG1731662.1 hypothetical protein EDB91DRAFT_1238915 [Suillus paluster]
MPPQQFFRPRSPRIEHPLLTFLLAHVSVSNRLTSKRPINVTDASSYLDAVKVQFHGQPDVYNHSLDMVKDFKSGLTSLSVRLEKFYNTTDAVDEREVSAEIARLFKDNPHLRPYFRILMPEKSQDVFDDVEESYFSLTGRYTRSNTPLNGKPLRRRPEPQPPIEPILLPRCLSAPESKYPTDLFKLTQLPLPPSHLPLDDTHFFDRVKRALGNRDTYNEFFKLMSLFTQELIDTTRVVRSARNFLGDAEWMRQFREILGWDDRRERERWVLDESQQQQTKLPLNAHHRTSPYPSTKYQLTIQQEGSVTCTGRDEMCRAVLNDEWVSHPTWSSEDAGFSEEERHEYDFHVVAATCTIIILESISAEILQLPPDERSAFKLKPNPGGSGKAVHARWEVLRAMQESPAIAIPEKEEEWKLAQRKRNKVWREVDARNPSRALDHAGIACKTSEKKRSLRKSSLRRSKLLGTPRCVSALRLVRHQLAYEVQDAVKMALSFLDRTQGQNGGRCFVGRLCLGRDGDDAETNSTRNGGGRKRKGGMSSGGDWRKKLLKSEQAKSTGKKTRAQEAASPSASRPASPAIPDVMQVDATAPEEGEREPAAPLRKASRKNVFFGNTVFYVLLRLLEVRALYSRLLFFKHISARIALLPQINLQNQNQSDDRAAHADHFYELMLESCERLFDNEIEAHVFEEQMRNMFGVKDAYRIFTIDKVIESLIKQVQLVLADAKSQELFEFLKRHRALQAPTIQDQLNSRRFAENVLGPDENIFRVDWLPDTKPMTIQLLGKDDSRFDDSEMLAERRALLRRNVPASVTSSTPAVLARSALETKVCVRTYRLFFVSGTEDFLWRIPSKEDVDTSSSAGVGREAASKRRERWLEKTQAGGGLLV